MNCVRVPEKSAYGTRLMHCPRWAQLPLRERTQGVTHAVVQPGRRVLRHVARR